MTRRMPSAIASGCQQGQTLSTFVFIVSATTKCVSSNCPTPMQASADVPNGFDERLRQRAAMADKPSNPLEMKAITVPNTAARPPGSGRIPNTPLSVSTISFVLGSLFSVGALTFLAGGFQRYWWTTAQLGFFAASWAAFHWGEFAVTAGWNREKCSVDCAYIILLLFRFFTDRGCSFLAREWS